MLFELCMVIGYAHPDYLLADLTAAQLAEWIEYASVFPIGGDRDDWRAAFSTANLASCWSENVDVASCKINWLRSSGSIRTREQLEAWSTTTEHLAKDK